MKRGKNANVCAFEDEPWAKKEPGGHHSTRLHLRPEAIPAERTVSSLRLKRHGVNFCERSRQAGRLLVGVRHSPGRAAALVTVPTEKAHVAGRHFEGGAWLPGALVEERTRFDDALAALLVLAPDMIPQHTTDAGAVHGG